MMEKIAAVLLTGSLLLTACATVGPDYRTPESKQLGVPQSYYGSATRASSEDASKWWERLNDPLLTRIVERAIGGNLDLKRAAARLRQAREGVVQARAAGVPRFTASGSAGQQASASGSSDTSLSLGADASWEADLFGGIRRGVEAARAGAEASAYDLAAVRVSIAAEVVNDYIQARLAQQRLALARETLAIAEENLDISQWRLQAGLVSSIDIEQARGQRAQTSATIPTLERNFSSAAFRLGVLTGQAPQALVEQLEAPKAIPSALNEVWTGIPTDTLRQRPDVRSAERSLAAETARIGVAEAELRSQLRLTGSIGTSALSIGGFIDRLAGSVFASLGQTIFDGGRLRSQVRSQRAATEAAFATYKQSVLTALEDVENGLAALEAAKARRAQFAEAAEAANNQAILARSQYRAGLSDFQVLLESERALLSARDGLLTSQADQTLAVVQLYRALGGGWDADAAAQDQGS